MVNKGPDSKLIIMVIGVSIIIGLGISNFCRPEFWHVSVSDLLIVLSALVLTFFYVEKRNDKERRNIAIDRIVTSIQRIIEDESLTVADERRTGLMQQQSCANKIKYLKDAKFSDIYDEVLFIEKEFEEIRLLFSEHMEDAEELVVIENDVNRHKQNISDRCDKIRMILYM